MAVFKACTYCCAARLVDLYSGEHRQSPADAEDDEETTSLASSALSKDLRTRCCDERILDVVKPAKSLHHASRNETSVVAFAAAGLGGKITDGGTYV
jgi:hypothetical protein